MERFEIRERQARYFPFTVYDHAENRVVDAFDEREAADRSAECLTALYCEQAAPTGA